MSPLLSDPSASHPFVFSKIEFIPPIMGIKMFRMGINKKEKPADASVSPLVIRPSFPSSHTLLPFFPLSVTLKLSEAGERTNCTHCHSNTVLMMATSVTWRFDWRVSGRGMGCEAKAQLTPQFCPLICFLLTSPSTYSSASALFLFSGSQ